MVEFICEHEPRSNTCVALAFAQTGYEVVIGARLKRAAWACDSTEGYKGGNNIGEFRSRTIQKEMMKTQQAQMSLTVFAAALSGTAARSVSFEHATPKTAPCASFEAFRG